MPSNSASDQKWIDGVVLSYVIQNEHLRRKGSWAMADPEIDRESTPWVKLPGCSVSQVTTCRFQAYEIEYESKSFVFLLLAQGL